MSEREDRRIEVADEEELRRELRRRTRRGFLSLGAAALAGAGLWKWLGTRPRVVYLKRDRR